MSPIESSVIRAGIFVLSFLPMPNGRKGKNIAVLNLVSKDNSFSCNKMLFVCCQVDKDCIVAEAMQVG